ncbi:MAG: hypothetical protein Devi2KO_36230 [Devosia indica]
MSPYADQLYWEGVGPDDLEDVVDYVRIEVYIVAETARGYYVNNVQSRRGSHYLDDRFVGTLREGIDDEGPGVIEVLRSWVEARKLQHWIEREVDIDDYPCLDDEGNEVQIMPRVEQPPRLLGPDEEPF